MKAQDIMTKNPTICVSGTKLDEVARMMVENDCGEIPVVRSKDKAELLGVITDRDICCRAVATGKNPHVTTASEVMSSPAVTVSPETDISQCYKLFEERIRLPSSTLVNFFDTLQGFQAPALPPTRRPNQKRGLS